MFGFSNSASDARLRSIERKLDLIIDALGIKPPPMSPSDQELRQLVLAGKKIEAIKLHRQRTGMGLKESKEYVEGLR